MIKPLPQTILQVISSNKLFGIPRYQRSYKWGADEAKELIEDVSSQEDAQELFLGTIIFEETDSELLLIVDGQQRITTIMFLLIACRVRAIKLENPDQARAIHDFICLKHPSTGKMTGQRLIACDAIRELYSHMTNYEWDGNFSDELNNRSVKQVVKRIKPVYEVFSEYVKDLDSNTLSGFLDKLYRAYVFRIDIKSDIQALGIFERTNARGIDLEVSDLLKNYLFSQTVENLEESWDEIRRNAGQSLLRLLKYFYVSREGYVTKPQLYKKLRGYAQRANVGATLFTAQLLQFSEYYRVVRSGTQADFRAYMASVGYTEIPLAERCDQIYRHIEGLREFGVVQFIPLGFAAIMCDVRTAQAGKSVPNAPLVRFFQLLENFHFLSVTCRKMGNEVEKPYADHCGIFSKSSDLTASVNTLREELLSRRPKLETFSAYFGKISYVDDELSFISYIFDRINNRGMELGSCKKIYDPDVKVKRKSFTVEHFFAQKAVRDPQLHKGVEDVIHDVGNLLMVPNKLNGALDDFPTAEKVTLLRGKLADRVADIRHVKEFLEEYGGKAATWDAEAIRARGAKLAKLAFEEVWAVR